MSESNNSSLLPRFEPGTKVRVKSGVAHPDYPDIPLGGWSGVIHESTQIENEVGYEVEWDQRTLDGIHPVYFKRCKRDDIEWEILWLGEADLEPDDGTPIAIEQPTEIRTPPLSKNDREDRIRRLFGLTHDDPLPDVSPDSLEVYFEYLNEHLNFPFSAKFWDTEDLGDFSRKRVTVTVTELLHPVPSWLGRGFRLICLCRDRDEEHGLPLDVLEVNKKDPNFERIADYTYWVQNWPSLDEDDDDEEFAYGPTSPSLGLCLKVCIGFGGWLGIVGATLGASFKTLPWAGLAALGGGIPLALIGAMALGWYGSILEAINRIRYGRLSGGLLGLLSGGLVGVVAGLMTLALPWSLLGLIAAVCCRPYLFRRRPGRFFSIQAALLGTCIGILVSAFRHNWDQAISGAISGAITGFAIAAGLVLLPIGIYFMNRKMSMPETGDEDLPAKWL